MKESVAEKLEYIADLEGFLEKLSVRFDLESNFVAKLKPLVAKVFDPNLPCSVQEQLFDEIIQTCANQHKLQTQRNQLEASCQEIALFLKEWVQVMSQFVTGNLENLKKQLGCYQEQTAQTQPDIVMEMGKKYLN